MAFHMSPMAVRTTIGSKNRWDGNSGSPCRCPVTVLITAPIPQRGTVREWSGANHHPQFRLGAMHDGIASKRKRLEVLQ